MTPYPISGSRTIGKLIREARVRSGLSQRSLARRAGTSQAAISRIERDLEQPTFKRADQILAGLGWRLEFELHPIAEHAADSAALRAAADATPSQRLEWGLSRQKRDR